MATVSARPSWWEIQVTDLDAAQKFYGAVFGWSFQPFGEAYVAAADESGNPGGGLYTSDSDPGPSSGRAPRIYFDTDGLEALLQRVRDAGGKVTNERTLISPEMGWWADFEDPSGVRIGLATDKAAA